MVNSEVNVGDHEIVIKCVLNLGAEGGQQKKKKGKK